MPCFSFTVPANAYQGSRRRRTRPPELVADCVADWMSVVQVSVGACFFLSAPDAFTVSTDDRSISTKRYLPADNHHLNSAT